MYILPTGDFFPAGEAKADSAAAAADAMLHSAPDIMSPGHPKPTPLPPRYAVPGTLASTSINSIVRHLYVLHLSLLGVMHAQSV